MPTETAWLGTLHKAVGMSEKALFSRLGPSTRLLCSGTAQYSVLCSWVPCAAYYYNTTEYSVLRYSSADCAAFKQAGCFCYPRRKCRRFRGPGWRTLSRWTLQRSWRSVCFVPSSTKCRRPRYEREREKKKKRNMQLPAVPSAFFLERKFEHFLVYIQSRKGYIRLAGNFRHQRTGSIAPEVCQTEVSSGDFFYIN